MSYQISKYPVEKLAPNADIQPGFAFKSECFTSNDEDLPLVKGENVHQGYIDWLGAKRWPAEDYESCYKYHLVPGDIVLAMDRPWVTAGLKWSYIKPHDPKALLVQRVARIRSRKKLDQNYLRHVISSNYFANYLKPIVTGVNVPHISGKQIGAFQIPIPKIEVQRKIASILTAYDELIEVNKRRIALLEKMAERIYREWFVSMRFPGHQDTDFVGGVPEGWNSIPMRDLIQHYIGGGWGEEESTAKFSEPAFVIRGTDIPSVQAGGISSIPFRFHTPSNLKSRAMESDDFVFEASGGSTNQLLGRNIRISQILLESFSAPVIPASFCKLIRFNRQLVSPFLMQQYLKLFYEQGLVGIFQVQSTGISNYQFESFLKHHKMLTPPSDIQRQFEDVVKPMLDLKDHLGLQTTVAIKTRGLLLPRLISGKLSVDDLAIQFPPSMQEVSPSTEVELEASHA